MTECSNLRSFSDVLVAQNVPEDIFRLFMKSKEEAIESRLQKDINAKEREKFESELESPQKNERRSNNNSYFEAQN